MVSKRSLNMSALNNGFRPRLTDFLPRGLALILGTIAAIENRLPVLPAIVTTIQADDRFLKLKTNRTSYAYHIWQGRAQKGRFTVVPRSGDERRDDAAIAVAEGHDLIAFAALWRQARAAGFTGGLRVVTEWVTRRRKQERVPPGDCRAPKPPSARNIARLMTTDRARSEAAAARTIRRIEKAVPDLATAAISCTDSIACAGGFD